MEQPPLFDPDADGIAARDEAIDQVEIHADQEWSELAYRAVRWVASRMDYFTTDDVWEALVRYHSEAGTHERRAMGAIMVRAARDGLIMATEGFRPTSRAVAHRGPKRIWRSLIR